jgi:AcrR family transcriptional regulator
MGRPKEFDRDAALKAATEVFWEKGFAGTSTEDLTTAMGIGRQSLYDTFGDKRRLYLEALGRYNTEQVGGHLALIRDGRSAPEAIEALLMAFVVESEDLRRLGCFGINAICEFGQHDPQVAAVGEPGAEAMQGALERLLRDGQAKGEIDPDLDPAAGARFINVTLAGLKVQARAGASVEALRHVAAFAARSLKPS